MMPSIEERVSQLEVKIVKLESAVFAAALVQPQQTQKQTSIKEFLLSCGADGDVQKTLAIGYFIEKFQGGKCFTTSALESCFKDAKEPIPKNIADKIYKNVSKGHIMDTKQKVEGCSAYILTNSGEQFVESKFKKGAH